MQKLSTDNLMWFDENGQDSPPVCDICGAPSKWVMIANGQQDTWRCETHGKDGRQSELASLRQFQRQLAVAMVWIVAALIGLSVAVLVLSLKIPS